MGILTSESKEEWKQRRRMLKVGLEAWSKKCDEDEESKVAFAAFARRMQRSLKDPLPKAPNAAEALATRIIPNNDPNDDDPFSVGSLQLLVEQFPGSASAKELLECATLAEEGKRSVGINNEQAASVLTMALKRQYEIVSWNSINATMTLAAMKTLHSDASQSPKTRAEALFVQAVLLHYQQEFRKSLICIRLAQQLLPLDPDFHCVEGRFLLMEDDSAGASKAFQRAAKLGCQQLRWTSLLSVASDSASRNLKYSTMEEYVRVVDVHDSDYPLACYCLAMHYASHGPEYLGTARRYYDQGEQSLENILPCFSMDAILEIRKWAHTMLKRYLACGNVKCSAAGSRACTGCNKIFYCSEHCQHQHWKEHKSTCRKHQRENNGR